ncbi:MAG TPA: C4-type zinc ribbon domain-containing protein [Leptolinea sp.]
MNPAFQLSRLQKIDTELDQISLRQQEINRLIQDETVLNDVKIHLNMIENEIKTCLRSLQEIEEKNHQFQMKLQESEHALYGGKVRLPRELQDLQNEIASLKRQITAEDEIQFNSMMQMDELEKNRSSVQSEYVEAQSVFATHVAGWKGENSTLEKKKGNLTTERNAVIQNLEEESLQKYEVLRKTKRGLAVALVSEQTCTGCGSMLTPADWQAARSPQRLVLCATCGRILYAG